MYLNIAKHMNVKRGREGVGSGVKKGIKRRITITF
jgi:hypothetical protein